MADFKKSSYLYANLCYFDDLGRCTGVIDLDRANVSRTPVNSLAEIYRANLICHQTGLVPQVSLVDDSGAYVPTMRGVTVSLAPQVTPMQGGRVLSGICATALTGGTGDFVLG